jgi:hypothetical protein
MDLIGGQVSAGEGNAVLEGDAVIVDHGVAVEERERE